MDRSVMSSSDQDCVKAVRAKLQEICERLMHDKYAVPALRALAEHCEAEYPLIAADLYAKADEIATRILVKVIDK